MSRSQSKGLLSFTIEDEEKLVVGAISREGRRTIYEGMEPDEYALVPKSELVDEKYDSEELGRQELRVDDLKVVGSSEVVTQNEDRDVELYADGEKKVSQGAPGVYGLLWIPLSDV